MEKLQAALDKARRERQGVAPPVNPAFGSGPASGTAPRPPSGVEALWSKLTPFDVPSGVLEKHRVVSRDAGPAAAPFDILRTKIIVQMRKQGWKRLAITSPMPRSGKTTIACNLALGLGRQHEMRSILIDLDLREPSVHEYFETQPPHSIGDMLTGHVSFDEQAMRIGENVAVSMARNAETDPTRLLLAEETAEVLDDIEARYQSDLMIFDLPSVLVNDDTRAFLKNVDCALIVIRANTTRYSQFDACEREIVDQTNVLGSVLNAYMNAANQND